VAVNIGYSVDIEMHGEQGWRPANDLLGIYAVCVNNEFPKRHVVSDQMAAIMVDEGTVRD